MGVFLLEFQFSSDFEAEAEEEVEMIDIGIVVISNEERRFVFLREIRISENKWKKSFKSRESQADEVEQIFSGNGVVSGILNFFWYFIVNFKIFIINSVQKVNTVKQISNVNKNYTVLYDVKIDFDDIRDEVEYWESFLVVCVLGCNFSIFIIEGFFKRIQGKWGIDKIVFLKKGIYLFRFYFNGNRNKVMDEGVKMFDKKFLIV